MRKTIGVVTTEHIAIGLVEDGKISGELLRYPEVGEAKDVLIGMPADAIGRLLLDLILKVAKDVPVSAIGMGFPGVIRNGRIEEAPNLHQIKGLNIQDTITAAFRERQIDIPVIVCNDADVMAAGIAAIRGHLDRLIRVWTLGNGIGFGRYPSTEGVWEGGHSVVTLDPKETYCGCGGKGHLEGIMGHRAMRLRFLDMEPEEVFAAAKTGDTRCADFFKLWHRALAAATATSIHMDGPGKFFITGTNARFLEVSLVNQYVHEMVKMSPLQGYSFEVVPGGDEIAVIGAAVNAERATFGA
jgi:glucokinase